MDAESNNNNLSAKALEDRKLILEGLAKRFEKKKLSERKNRDGSLAYQDFLDRMEKIQEVPVHIIKSKRNL